MAIRGIDAPEDRNGKRKNNKNRLLLAGLIALALLSLFILLGNPGLWTPDDDNEPQAEATNGDDGAGNSTDSEESAQEPASNATQIDETTGVTNTTSSNGGIDDDDDGSNTSSRDPNIRPDGSGYVIIYGGDDDDSDSNSNDGGGFGGGGGGGGHRSDDDDDDNNNKSTVNKSPTAQDLSVSTGEDTPVIVQLAGSDPDGDDIEYSMVSTPLYGSAATLDVVTGSLVYTPASNYNGSDSFTFSVTDSHGADDTAVVSITIIPADDAPIVSNSTSATTDEDQPVKIDLSQSVFDPDGPDTMISIINMTQPLNGMATLHANNTVTYSPSQDFNGLDWFSFQATDGVLVSNLANVTVTVLPINDESRAQNITVATPEDTPVDIVLINGTSDVDGDVSGLVIIQLPSNGFISINPDNSTVTYTPNENYEGGDGFEYVISDGISNSTGSVNISVLPVNDPPSIVDGILGSVTVDEDGSTQIDIISNVFDPDGDVVTITNVTQPAHGTAVLNPNGTVTYTPDPNYNGEDRFEFTVDDGNGGTTTGTVIVTVSPVNDVPVSSNGTASVDEDSVTDLQLNSTDSDGDTLIFTLASLPDHGTASIVDSTLGILRYTPDPNFNGLDSLTFHTTDGKADSAIATLLITINPVNDEPTANDDKNAGIEDIPMDLDVLANDFDIDGDTLAVEEISSPASHGTATINADSSITYTPELDYNGTDSFGYKINDGNGGSSIATVQISIGAINDAPVAMGGSANLDEDGTIDIALNATDSDGNPIQYSIISMPSQGSLEVTMPDGSAVRYLPSADYNGLDGFTFQATDGIEDSGIAAVTITVAPVNDNPVANSDNIMGQEDTVLGGNLLANDLDIDGDTLAAVNATSTAHGILSLAADGSFSYSPEPDFNGADSFQYIVSDGNGGFAAGHVLITVAQSNDAPIASDDWAYTTLSQPVFLRVLDNDTDIDSATLNVGSVGAPSHGTVSIRADGKGVVYTPANGYSGMDQFTYTVTDGSLSDAGTVTIKVYNIKFGHIQPPVGGGGEHEFEQGNTANVRLTLKDASGNDIVNALVILQLQKLDDNTSMPSGPVLNATSAGGANEDNMFDYGNSWYQYNLKTDNMTQGKWALYVYMIDTTTDPATKVLLEDPPIDGISTTIVVK